MGGNRLWGYTSSMQVVPAEAEAVREVAARLLAGESLRQIARDLNARRVRSTTGKEWTGNRLSQALRSPRLAGLRKLRSEIVSGDWQPIISPGTHAALVALLSRPPAEPAHLLAGLLVCGLCDRRLKAYRRAGNYACPPEPRGCGGIAVSMNHAERRVVDELFGGTLPEWWEAAPLDERRDAVDWAFLEIRVEGTGKIGNRFDPTRIKFVRYVPEEEEEDN